MAIVATYYPESAKPNIWRSARKVWELFRGRPRVVQFYQRADDFVGCLERLLATLIHTDEDGEIILRCDPDVRAVHRVVARVIEGFAARPTTLTCYPAERIITTERRRVQLLI